MKVSYDSTLCATKLLINTRSPEIFLADSHWKKPSNLYMPQIQQHRKTWILGSPFIEISGH